MRAKATIEDRSFDDAVELAAAAPAGFVFVSTRTHSVVACIEIGENGFPNKKSAMKVAKAMLADDIEGGFEPCQDTDCDICS